MDEVAGQLLSVALEAVAEAANRPLSHTLWTNTTTSSSFSSSSNANTKAANGEI